MRIYVAGAYSKGDVAVNVRDAVLWADELLKLGHTPYVPHLTHFWHFLSPKDYEFWLAYDLSFLEHWAEGVFRIHNISAGADKEVERAQELGLPVFYYIEDVPKPTLQ